MKKLVVLFLAMFACSVATADIRSETKKEQDRAYQKGSEARKKANSGKRASPKKDGYRDMSEGEKEAYKKGYRGD